MMLARRYWLAGAFASLMAHGAGAALLLDTGSQARMERAAGTTSIVVGSMQSALAAQAQTPVLEPLETTGTTAKAVTPAEAPPAPDAETVRTETPEETVKTDTPPAETPPAEQARPVAAQKAMTLAAIDPQQIEAVEPPPVPSPRPPRASDHTEKPAARTGRAIKGKAQKARALDNSRAGTETPQRTARRSQRTGEGGSGAVRGGNARLSNYQGMILSRIQRAKQYPHEARRRGIEGVAVLSFTIASNGRVSGARIARSSGHAVLDQAVMALIRRAGPFPPIPPDIGRSRLAIRVPIQFAVR